MRSLNLSSSALMKRPRLCPADGGELLPHVEQKDGQLHFSKVTRSDAGNYTCIASNSLQGEIRALVTLIVAGKLLPLLASEAESENHPLDFG